MTTKSIVVVLLLVILLAVTIELTRVEYVSVINNRRNASLLDYNNLTPEQLESSLLSKLPGQRYLIVYDDTLPVLAQIRDNVVRTLGYLSKQSDVFPLSVVQRVSADYSAIILIADELIRSDFTSSLMDYVFAGGRVFFAHRLGAVGDFASIYRKLGISEYGNFVEAVGMKLHSNVLIKGKGLFFEAGDLWVNSALSLSLDSTSEVLAESANGVKLLWKKDYGRGRFVYFNGTNLGEKLHRGLLAGSLSMLEDVFLYPVVNSKVMFIDDFPAPIPKNAQGLMQEAFGRTVERFYRDIWWPDMVELAAKYGLKYTAVVIETYNDSVDKIIDDTNDLSMKDYISFGRDLVSQGGELGIHGHNHQPLTLHELDEALGYSPWKDIAIMRQSIEHAIGFARAAFPEYDFRVYVPPSNILSSDGRSSLPEEIAIISSLYVGDSSVEYVQEIEVSADDIVELPRFTAGYGNSTEQQWVTLNSITIHGMVAHFVHPDDVLDYGRSNDLGWEHMLKQYDEFNKYVAEAFPWLRGMTASEGAGEVIKYSLQVPRFDIHENAVGIYIDNYYGVQQFMLRTTKVIQSSENCVVEKIDDQVYLVTVKGPISRVNFGG